MPPIQDVYALLAGDAERNRLIVEDVVPALQAKRSPVVLTERREHLDTLAQLLSQRIRNVVVMAGAVSFSCASPAIEFGISVECSRA